MLAAAALGAFAANSLLCRLALASGTVASGLGYVIWYAAVRRLTALRAAAVQLSVPALAALGGVVLLHEQVTWRLALASAAVLGGIAVVLQSRVPALRIA